MFQQQAQAFRERRYRDDDAARKTQKSFPSMPKVFLKKRKNIFCWCRGRMPKAI